MAPRQTKILLFSSSSPLPVLLLVSVMFPATDTELPRVSAMFVSCLSFLTADASRSPLAVCCVPLEEKPVHGG